jgi:phosphoglycolate phosphatase
MTAKVVLFDFDGTIADTYSAIVKITNQLSSEFGYKALNEEELLLLKNLSSREIVKLSEISIFKIPFLVRRVRAELSKEIGDLSPIQGISSILFELKNRGYILGIVTSNDQDNVEMFLSKNKLDFLFSYIYSSTSIFGKHRVINQVIQNNQLNKADVIYVGDETRDIRSSRRSNIGIVAVSWGFNSADILKEYQPDYLVHQPQELLKVIDLYHHQRATTTVT